MKPYRKNPRTITKKRLARLTETLARLGDLGGIVHNLTTDEIVGGNQRMRVFAEGVPQIVETLPEPDDQGTVAHGFVIWQGKKYAYRQVRWDVKTAEEANIAANIGAGDWNWDVLANEWNAADLMDWGLDEDLFAQWKTDAGALGNLIESEKPETVDAEPMLDRAEELREKWGVESGMMFALGDHRLICGDCTDPATVARVMGGEKADMVFTDPPYGIEVVNKTGKVGGGTKQYPTSKFEKITGDETTDCARLFFENCVGLGFEKFILWGGNYFTDFLSPSRCWVVWFKNHVTDRTFANCELAWTNIEGNSKTYSVTWDGYTKQGESGSKIHPTQKPVKLCTDVLADFTDAGAIVFDGFAGSGTSLIACQNLGRKARAVEISPGYVAVCLERFLQAFGITGVLVE